MQPILGRLKEPREVKLKLVMNRNASGVRDSKEASFSLQWEAVACSQRALEHTKDLSPVVILAIY